MISFIDHFDQNFTEIIKTTPPWFNQLRQEGLTRLSQLSFPSTKDEEWKYTNISSLLQRTYQLPTQTTLLEVEKFESYTRKDPILIVFINGVFSSQYSRLDKVPDGVKITSLAQALRDKNDVPLQKALTTYASQQESIFTLLNKIMVKDGAYIAIADKTICPDLIHIVYVTSGSQKEMITCPRSLMSVGKSAQATVLESHLSFNDEDVYFSNALTDIFVGENATVHYCKAQKESSKAFHINATRVAQERNSHFNSFVLTTGGQITRNNLDISLNGEGCSACLNGLYAPYGTQLIDNHTCVDHRFPNSGSNQLYKGILNHAARGIFNGKIIVRSIAQKTNSYQLNKNLLLGKECRVDTKPQLEISADDVKCTHGATIGQLNEEELFYLQTRGIFKKNAVKMLAEGFINDMIGRISSEGIRLKLNSLLSPAFATLGEQADLPIRQTGTEGIKKG